MNEKPLRAAIYGSCHAPAVQTIIERQPELDGRIAFRETPLCFNITESEFEALRNDIKNLDLLVYQPISPENRGEKFATARLIEAAAPSTKIISFQYFHLEIYSPFFIDRVNSIPLPPFGYLDYHFAAMVARGMSDSEIVDRLQNETCFDPYAEQALTQGLTALREREDRVLPGEKPVDIRLTDIVAKSYRTTLLNHSFNHPTMFLLDIIVRRVRELNSEIANILHPRRSYSLDPMAIHRIHVPNFVRRIYGLDFPEGKSFAQDNNTLSVEQYVDQNRSHYEGLGADTIFEAIDLCATRRKWFEALRHSDFRPRLTITANTATPTSA